MNTSSKLLALTQLPQTQAQGSKNLGTFESLSPYGQGVAVESGQPAANTLERFISNIIGALTLVAGLFFVFYFVMGGLNWITAGGEKGKIEKAREQMVQAVIGMIVIVISYGLIGVIGTFLGLDLLRPGNTFLNVLNPNKGGTTTIQQQQNLNQLNAPNSGLRGGN